jgi:hypothetical protein
LFSPECKNPQRPRENGEIEMKREIQRDRERERPEIEKERLIE